MYEYVSNYGEVMRAWVQKNWITDCPLRAAPLYKQPSARINEMKENTLHLPLDQKKKRREKSTLVTERHKLSWIHDMWWLDIPALKRQTIQVTWLTHVDNTGSSTSLLVIMIEASTETRQSQLHWVGRGVILMTHFGKYKNHDGQTLLGWVEIYFIPRPAPYGSLAI